MTNESVISKEVRARIRRVQRAMRKHHKNSALIVSSGIPKQRSRDLVYSFSQEENFFYLTCSQITDSSLIVFSDERKSLLITPEISKEKILWDGKGEAPERIARRTGARLVFSQSTLSEVRKALHSQVDWLFYPNEIGQDGYSMARELLATPSHHRKSAPIVLAHLDTILEPLRLQKSAFEISRTKSAVQTAWEGLKAVRSLIKPGASEESIALSLRHAIERQNSAESFPSIVASGPNAAVLHHSPSSRTLRDGEYLTIDFGAIADGYASDVTRVFSIGDKLPPTPHREALQLLTETQQQMVSRIRPGRVWKDLQDETEELLLKGLLDIGLLKGSLPKLRKARAIRKFFPHSLGHSLGLAVHDVGALRSTGDAKLLPGMIVTVEPGIYLQQGTKKVPAFGMRIEDDILVTKKGATNLTRMIPKE